MKHKTNYGASRAKTTGIENSDESFVMFGEDDVLLDKDYLKFLMICLERNGADLVAGRIIYLKNDELKSDALERCNSIQKPLIDMNLIGGNFGVKTNKDIEVPFVHALFLAKKNIFGIVSYDHNILSNGFREETDPQIAALKKGSKIVFCPHAICYHLPRIKVRGGGQWTKNDLSYTYWTIRNNNYFLDKHYPYLKDRYKLKHSIYWMKFNFILNAIKLFFFRIISHMYYSIRERKY